MSLRKFNERHIYITHHLDLRQPNTSCKHASQVRVKSEKLQYKHWHSSISIMKLKLGFEHLEDRVVTHLMDLGCQATFDRFFRGYERFYTCAARHPTGHRKGTWASGTWPCFWLGCCITWTFNSIHGANSWEDENQQYLFILWNPDISWGARTLDDLWSTIPAGHSVQLLRGADTTDAREFQTRRSYLGMPKETHHKINVGL